ncbi:MAG: tripartite tricarboxylate transporter substrate binding protein [Desulfarculaceae bacterium]|nr:tripartite tricarboxylate transporter substrate binding protein [Desulfarculaceae bacterium]MCF8047891.1 tripartite tricarboxylate transporter substrate binding protein [Desulfarculaceae bacterium]MCF8066834.1 tripartite tricarboxylate transporter substrate binding protein [Desulfarculaceae bacterium]MCF8099054.1 tripartite tricarboxylate transporter substrate binding protein [Desulfarculaceae bacterium]MCF8122488.1 tripartite tricarboxylate transporter substrate binding protein [Desulfarcul
MKKLMAVLTCCLALALVAVPALAKDYPAKPITAYIPLSAGGTTDVFVRTIAPYMEKFLGKSLILVNKPGSGGAVAISTLAKAKPDGYTFSWANLPTLVTIPQMRKLTYDPKDLVYIASPMHYDYILYVKKDSPYNSLKELIDFARKNPGKATYGTPGLGTTNHLGVAWLANHEKVKMTPIPFKGNPKSVAAVLGGHVVACNTSTTASVSAFKGGRLKPLVIMSANRIPLTPDTKTLKELGYDFSQFSCLGAVFPKGTPEPIRKKIEDAIKFALSQPDVQKKAKEELYVSIDFLDGKKYRELCDQYWGIWGGILKEVGLKKY